AVFRVGRSVPNIHPTTASRFEPTELLQFLKRGTHGVCVYTVASCQFARTRQAFSSGKFAGQDREFDLRDELFADRDVSIAGQPEAHHAHNSIVGVTLSAVSSALITV